MNLKHRNAFTLMDRRDDLRARADRADAIVFGASLAILVVLLVVQLMEKAG